jgi:hypothetical protein
VFRIWGKRNQELWLDLRLESVVSEAEEWEYGRSVDSILPRSFGRKSQVRGDPARFLKSSSLKYFLSISVSSSEG